MNTVQYELDIKIVPSGNKNVIEYRGFVARFFNITWAHAEDAFKNAKAVIRDISGFLDGEVEVRPSKSPIYPAGTPEYDGRWKTTYSIFSDNILAVEVTVIEQYSV